MLQAAEAGKPAGQYNVGCALFLGKGVARDQAAAAEQFMLAAEADFFPAQVNLANMYQSGAGVPLDLKQALYWYARNGCES